jgi:hypothetical protein
MLKRATALSTAVAPAREAHRATIDARDLSGRWGADDEPLHDLLKVLLCYGNVGFDGRRQRDEDLTRRLVPCECFVSRSIPPPSEKAPTVEDLDRELDAELGRIPSRHE